MNVLPQIDAATKVSDDLWFKDAIIYQLHVKAFADSNSDGIGDFEGLTERLDYLQDLGVTALWLLPFYPSPGKDDGYDIADYRRINPDFGTMRDFRRFMTEAHRRGLRVITELVINHTSDQHPWFATRATQLDRDRCPQLVRLERQRSEIRRHAHHLSRTLRNPTGPGTAKPAPSIGTGSSAHQPDLNYANPRRSLGHCPGDAALARHGR